MTDELTPEQEAEISRLLAEARHDEPTPAGVAARLDAALEQLADEGADDLEVFESASPDSTVTDLAGVRHRRRNAGRLLLAAAAVVIGGVAVGQTLGDTTLSEDGSADSADAGGLAEAPREADDGSGHEESGSYTSSEDTAAGGAPVPVPAQGEVLLEDLDVPLRLTSDNFAGDVQRELSRTAAARSQAADSNFDGLVQPNAGFVCADGAYGEGAKLPALYDEQAAVLVLRRPRSGLQQVDLLACGTATPLDSVVLPTP